MSKKNFSLGQADIMNSLHVLIITSQGCRMRPTIWTVIARKIRKVMGLNVAHDVWLLFTIIITITALPGKSFLYHFNANLLIPVNSDS